MTEVCDGCGKECENAAGLSAHQRHCDEYEEGDSSDSTEQPTTVSPRGAEMSEVEAAAYERDDEVCQRCGESAESVHYLRPSVERVANLRAVCRDCDEYLEGLNRHTKKTEIRRGA